MNMDISLTDALRHLSTILMKLNISPVTIIHRGKPAGVLVSPADYEAFKKMKKYFRKLSLSMELKDCKSACEVSWWRFNTPPAQS
jgi:prevent-host-death family protein